MVEKPELPDAAKAAIAELGIMPGFKDAAHVEIAEIHALKKKAQAVSEDLQQLIGGGTLDEATTQKLSAALGRLRGALQGGAISTVALAAALSEAVAAIGATENSSRASFLKQKTEQLWQRIDQCNNEIDDDFEKMRKAGILFDEKLWNRHKELSEELQAHPHDLRNQKELDAIDDQLLRQAEPQLCRHPGAKPQFDDAQKKSEDRHQLVDHDLAALDALKKKALIANSGSDLDWNTGFEEQGKDATVNDFERSNLTHKAKSIDRNAIPNITRLVFLLAFFSTQMFVRMHTNVCFRTKINHKPALLPVQ